MLDERRCRATLRQRHVLAAPEKGIISGRTPAILEVGQGWLYATGAIHGPMDAVWRVGGVHIHGAFPVKIRVGTGSIARSGADGGSNFGWRSSFGRGGGSGKRGWDAAALRHLFTAPLDHPITTPHENEWIHPAPPAWLRVQPANHTAGPWEPGAIWGGRCSDTVIGLPLAERLPEIGMQPAPATAKSFADGCRIRHMHRWLRSHSQRRDWSNQRLACTRHRASPQPRNLQTLRSLSTPDARSRLPIGRPFAWVRVPSRRVTPGCSIWFVSSLTPLL
jgi:hypothetical protein